MCGDDMIEIPRKLPVDVLTFYVFLISGIVVALPRRWWNMEADSDAKWAGPLVLPNPSLSTYAPADKQKTKAEPSDYTYI